MIKASRTTKMTLNENFFRHVQQFVDDSVQENKFEAGTPDFKGCDDGQMY